jgi:hypothetical protein
MKKSENMQILLCKMVLAQHFCTEAGISHNKVVDLLEKILIDMI